MRVKLLTRWENLRSSYWFLPSLLAVLAAVLAVITIEVDKYFVYEQSTRMRWIYAGSADGALTLLATVAGSMMTVAGVTFSITIVALTLATSQFGPRLLNNFMRDRGNQLVLGTYIATFIYCLLVMRTIRSTSVDLFVPPISIATGLFLAFTSLGVLIYFIHHISTSIKVEYVIASVDREIDATIDRLYPRRESDLAFEQHLRDEDDVPAGFAGEEQAVPAVQEGYVQAIDYEALLDVGRERDFLMQVELRPGDFVTEGDALVQVRSDEGLDEEVRESISAAFVVGKQRVQRQDLPYLFNQQVEIAVRALSPGINDPFTAMICLDHLGAALSSVAGRATPSAYYYDDDGNLRLIRQSVTFGELVDTALNPIRQYAWSNFEVTMRVLETIGAIGVHVRSETQRQALRRQALLIRSGARNGAFEEMDRRAIELQYQRVLSLLRKSAN